MKRLALKEEQFLKKVGTRIRVFRVQSGLSLEVVANKTTKTPEWLQEVEMGTKDIAFDELIAIAQALDVNPQILFDVALASP